MFLDCLEIIFDSLETVVSSFDVTLFYVGSVDISFWELILGLLVVGIIFSFFLTPRSGSVLQAVSNENAKNNAENARSERQKQAEARRQYYQNRSKK